MSVVFKVQVLFSLFVLAIIVKDCGGIVFIKGSRSKPRQKATMCRFDNRNYTIGHTWHPYLEPNGINYCILCRCQKNGFTHCARKRCAAVSCPGMKPPKGKCCPVCPVSTKPASILKHCNHGGNRYSSGQVWETLIRDPDKRKNDCANCVCNNGVVSCTIRICQPLKCPAIFQRKERNTCCKRCGGIPLQAEGETSKKNTKYLKGSCKSNGLHYQNREIWNPITLPSEIKAFQFPNCRLCSCQNTNVTCNSVQCSRLTCKNPIRKHPKDCCKSCPSPKSPGVSPIIFLHVPQMKKPKDSIYPHCNFTKKVYKHNTSWNPDIPGLTTNLCVRCSCKYTKVSCGRTVCKNGGSCANNCLVSKPKKKPPPKIKSTRQRDCSGERVQVYLLVNGGQRKTKIKRLKQSNYIVRIGLIYSKNNNGYMKIHHWNVGDKRARFRNSKLTQTRFERRKAKYIKLGETKTGRIRRFLYNENILKECKRNCKNKAKDFINVLRNRVRYFKKDCKSVDSFRSLVPSPM